MTEITIDGDLEDLRAKLENLKPIDIAKLGRQSFVEYCAGHIGNSMALDTEINILRDKLKETKKMKKSKKILRDGIAYNGIFIDDKGQGYQVYKGVLGSVKDTRIIKPKRKWVVDGTLDLKPVTLTKKQILKYLRRVSDAHNHLQEAFSCKVESHRLTITEADEKGSKILLLEASNERLESKNNDLVTLLEKYRVAGEHLSPLRFDGPKGYAHDSESLGSRNKDNDIITNIKYACSSESYDKLNKDNQELYTEKKNLETGIISLVKQLGTTKPGDQS